MVERTTQIALFLDSEQIGYGTITYTDDFSNMSEAKSVLKTVSAPVYIDNEQIGELVLSYTDVIAYGGGGEEVRNIPVTVAIDSNAVGSGYIQIVDSYGSVTEIRIAPFALLVILILVVLVIGSRRRSS